MIGFLLVFLLFVFYLLHVDDFTELFDDVLDGNFGIDHLDGDADDLGLLGWFEQEGLGVGTAAARISNPAAATAEPMRIERNVGRASQRQSAAVG